MEVVLEIKLFSREHSIPVSLIKPKSRKSMR